MRELYDPSRTILTFLRRVYFRVSFIQYYNLNVLPELKRQLKVVPSRRVGA